ncbi:MAG: hypothetical protein C1O27_001777 [Chloroflexi bacterium]|jgi:hypothetical protein|nr:MAG: hypothetical protein C1O27_001777 [Chloroflexota bacterium]
MEAEKCLAGADAQPCYLALVAPTQHYLSRGHSKLPAVFTLVTLM